MSQNDNPTYVPAGNGRHRRPTSHRGAQAVETGRSAPKAQGGTPLGDELVAWLSGRKTQ